MRYALIVSRGSQWDDTRVVSRYLPDNYEVLGVVPGEFPGEQGIVIGGEDVAGWTLDGYVLPRLASGRIFGHEIESPPALLRSKLRL
ncbi:MAG: hypothetical protein KatS3mg015_2497 [Fimbriimonadales bacterium]|nr:MAG: hypothetical protein KatS3mg015_2497 [Fimbriimonadales bacterium]